MSSIQSPIKALIAGGENRESNLGPALVAAHREETNRQLAEKSKVARIRSKHLGISKPSGFRKAPEGHRWFGKARSNTKQLEDL